MAKKVVVVLRVVLVLVGGGGRLIPQCILCKTVSLTSNGKLLVI